MKPLTRREALEKCYEVWKWLAQNPEASKEDAFEELGLDKMHNNCHCCEYSETHNMNHCLDNCIIKWPTLGCCMPESPYRKWDNFASIRLSRAAAYNIANLAREALFQLD